MYVQGKVTLSASMLSVKFWTQRKRRYFFKITHLVTYSRETREPFLRCNLHWCQDHVSPNNVSPNEKSRLVPRTMCLLDNAALGYCVPWTWRPTPMCSDPGLHKGTCQDKLFWVMLGGLLPPNITQNEHQYKSV